MRLNEFISEHELGMLRELIYKSTWQALYDYQMQRSNQQRIASKTATTLKPQAAKTARTLARKAKRPAYAATPKPLPKPKQQPQAQTNSTPAYRPVKAPTPLPASTKTVAARSEPKPAPQSAKIPPSMQPLPSGLVAMIHAKSDPVLKHNQQQERG